MCQERAKLKAADGGGGFDEFNSNRCTKAKKTRERQMEFPIL